MKPVVIENPILNSPFTEPARHFRFTDDGITNEIALGRRSSSYFIPIAQPKKKTGREQQPVLYSEWTRDRIEENKLVNKIRQRVGAWRDGGHVGVTPTTARLLAYWTDPAREKRFFYCQIEALETAIYLAEVAKPILRPYDAPGSTRHVDFDTVRPVYATRPDKCQVSHVVADTESWEQKLAQTLEDMPEVLRYVKNEHVGCTIPYTLNGEERHYIPDFLACLDDGHGPADPLNLILEVTGEKKKDKAAKVATARTLWVPALNNHGGYGRWAFLEIGDPWDAQNRLRQALRHASASKA